MPTDAVFILDTEENGFSHCSVHLHDYTLLNVFDRRFIQLRLAVKHVFPTSVSLISICKTANHPSPSLKCERLPKLCANCLHFLMSVGAKIEFDLHFCLKVLAASDIARRNKQALVLRPSTKGRATGERTLSVSDFLAFFVLAPYSDG
jgi:hypothetical protein